MIVTDRSRWLRGLQRCPRARFLQYEMYKHDEVVPGGIVTAAEHLPLATGRAIHAPLAQILGSCVGAFPAPLPDRDDIRTIIEANRKVFIEETLTAGSFAGHEEGALPEQFEFLVAEQTHLIEALVWAFYRTTLPWLLDTFEIIAVEREELCVLDCTCGATGSWMPDLHEARGCQGVILMTRPDFVTRNKQTGGLAVWDFKSSAYELDTREYEHQVQFALGTLGVEERLGEPVSQWYVLGLMKGKREADRGDQSTFALKKQRSSLCYGYYQAPNPPFTKGDLRYDYTRAQGYGRTPLWTLLTAEEWVMDRLPMEEVQRHISLVGPNQRPDFLLKRMTRQIADYERLWAANAGLATTWDDIDRAAPQSWDCMPYRDSPCEYIPICYQHPGWEDPLSLVRPDGKPKYQLRVANHEYEREK